MNKSLPVIIVVQDFLLRVLALLDIDDADLELGLDEDLVKLHQLLAGVRQLTEGEWRVQVDLPTQTRHHLQHDITNLFLYESNIFSPSNQNIENHHFIHNSENIKIVV